MGFLKNLFGGTSSTGPTVMAMVSSTETRWVTVEGVQQDNVRPYIHSKVRDFRSQRALDQVAVTLIPDPTIRDVENALRVDLAGRSIGHMPANVTFELHWMLGKAVDAGGAGYLVAPARFSWQLKDGPFRCQVGVPQNWGRGEVVPMSQVRWV